MNIAIIPARGGSKRIPRKNIRSFCGKPMIAWSIEAAMASGVFNQVIVSTDDTEIATISQARGAAVPYMRPSKLADDHTPTISVVKHMLEWMEKRGQVPDYVCCLYATAPFVTASTIRQGFEILKSDHETDFVLSTTRFSFPIFRGLKVREDGRVSMLWPDHVRTRSQDLPESYHDAGQFYWGTTQAFLNFPGVHAATIKGNVRMLTLPNHCVQDIDTEEDWVRAEYLMNSRPDRE